MIPDNLPIHRGGGGRPLHPRSTKPLVALRQLLTRWQGRNLQVQPTGQLLKLRAKLDAAGAEQLALASTHGPRLLAAVTTELSGRADAPTPTHSDDR